MRATSWGIPLPRVRAHPGLEAQNTTAERTPEEEEALLRVWVRAYQRRLQAFALLGLSIGAPRDDIDARYATLQRDVLHNRDAFEKLGNAYQLALGPDATPISYKRTAVAAPRVAPRRRGKRGGARRSQRQRTTIAPADTNTTS